MKTFFGPLVLLMVASCVHGSPLPTPKLDEIHRTCEEWRASKPASSPTRIASRVGARAVADPAGTPVKIYGASWCSACATAAAYLTRRGIPFVERDIEEDKAGEVARVEALTSAGLAPTRDLPVIDVRGTITVGFLPCVLEEAWSAP